MRETFLLFFTVALTEFFAEMGDKTQLMLIGLTSKYKIRDIILGTLVAVLVLNGIAVTAGGFLNEFIPLWIVKICAGGAFLYFSLSALSLKDEEDEDSALTAVKFAPLAVFCTFFIAEFGDKTQLTAITFGADNGLKYVLVIWISCSAGLFLADIIGMLAGLFLKKKAGDRILLLVSFVLFGIFGFLTLKEGFELFNRGMRGVHDNIFIPVAPVLTGLFILFAATGAFFFLRIVKQRKIQ